MTSMEAAGKCRLAGAVSYRAVEVLEAMAHAAVDGGVCGWISVGHAPGVEPSIAWKSRRRAASRWVVNAGGGLRGAGHGSNGC